MMDDVDVRRADLGAAVAWRVDATGGKFAGAWGNYNEPLLPAPGTPERVRLDQQQAETVAGLLAAYRQRPDAVDLDEVLDFGDGGTP